MKIRSIYTFTIVKTCIVFFHLICIKLTSVHQHVELRHVCPQGPVSYCTVCPHQRTIVYTVTSCLHLVTKPSSYNAPRKYASVWVIECILHETKINTLVQEGLCWMGFFGNFKLSRTWYMRVFVLLCHSRVVLHCSLERRSIPCFHLLHKATKV